MSDKERKAIIMRVLSANLMYYKNRQYLQLLNKVIPYSVQSSTGFDISLMFEMERVEQHQRLIQNYIKTEISKLIGIRWFGEVLGSEIIEDTITTTPIGYISHTELKDNELILNELVPNKYGTHFVGTRALTLDLKTGKIKEDKDTQRCKIIKIPKVALD